MNRLDELEGRIGIMNSDQQVYLALFRDNHRVLDSDGNPEQGGYVGLVRYNYKYNPALCRGDFSMEGIFDSKRDGPFLLKEARKHLLETQVEPELPIYEELTRHHERLVAIPAFIEFKYVSAHRPRDGKTTVAYETVLRIMFV